MPIEYAGGGVLAEHEAVRTRVGLFDVSHLGTATVRGPGAAAFVDNCLTNDLSRIEPGQAQYTMCCLPDGDPRAGGVVDDLIVYLHGPDDVLLVPNAANAAEVVARLADAAPAGVTVTDRHTEVAVRAGELWDVLVETGQDEGLRLCGLGARDTLRTEMGYPLHGHELSTEITPVQARAGWAVGWRKPVFWGRQALMAEKEAGPARLLWGLRATGRGIPRPGMAVLDADRAPVGEG